MKWKLLILDDVPEMSEWLAEGVRVEWPNSSVRTTGTALEFHRALQRERPDLVLIDEVLGPGEDLAGILRVTETERLRVILMTGILTESINASRPVPPGVVGRVQKPSWETGRGLPEFLIALKKLRS